MATHGGLIPDKYHMRNFIDIIVEHQVAFPDHLPDAEAIADYITDLDPKASYDDIESFFADNYPGCGATLQTVRLSDLSPGHPDANIPSASKEKRYSKLATTAPPLVVADGQIMDGNHRYRVAMKRGDTEILCYVVDDD